MKDAVILSKSVYPAQTGKTKPAQRGVEGWAAYCDSPSAQSDVDLSLCRRPRRAGDSRDVEDRRGRERVSCCEWSEALNLGGNGVGLARKLCPAMQAPAGAKIRRRLSRERVNMYYNSSPRQAMCLIQGMQALSSWRWSEVTCAAWLCRCGARGGQNSTGLDRADRLGLLLCIPPPMMPEFGYQHATNAIEH